MSGVSTANRTKSISLAILMIMMAQVGYLELLNPWNSDKDTLDQTSNMPDDSDAALSSNSPAVDILNGYQLSTRGLHTCSTLDNGSLMCWGLNNRGQVGDGTTTNAHTPQLVDLGSGAIVTEVANGYRHTCATLENGSLYCWGENSAGELGNGQQYTSQTTPLWVDLGAGRTAVRIDADMSNTCAVVDNGSLYCWGTNNQGQLNDDPSQLTGQTTPRWIDLGGNVASTVSVGSLNVCSILNNGSLYCWGDDSYGQLARGGVSGLDSWTPVYVDFGAGVTVAQINLGDQHLCAIVDNGSVYCWGRNANGGLGNGSASFADPTSTPSWVDLGTGRTAVAVSAGGFHTCAIVDNGSVYCWGANYYGQVGDGTTTDVYTPQWVDLGVGRTAIAVSAGYQHTCAILDNSSTVCWGSDYSGQLGNGPGQSDSSVSGIVDGGFTWSTSTGSNSGGSSSNNTLTPSVEGAELLVGQAMTNITFQYNASAASGSGGGSGGGSGSGSGTTTNGNGTTWQVADLRSGSSTASSSSYPGGEMGIVVGDTIYFDADDGISGAELWAHDNSNASTWQVADLRSGASVSSYLGRFMEILIGDTIYFDAIGGSSGIELWAHDTSNASFMHDHCAPRMTNHWGKVARSAFLKAPGSVAPQNAGGGRSPPPKFAQICSMCPDGRTR